MASAYSPEQFINRWQNASGSELANAQSFVRELTELRSTQTNKHAI